MDAPMINHRGPEFRDLLPELEQGLQWAFQTENDMLIFPASGTGGLESAVANIVSPGERILAVTIGTFGDRFADLATAFGADVVRYTVPWGEGADPQDLDDLLSREPEIATVLVTHNETSTGVTNPMRALADVVSVAENAGQSQVWRSNAPMAEARLMSGDAGGMGVEGGETTVRATVTVRWALGARD